MPVQAVVLVLVLGLVLVLALVLVLQQHVVRQPAARDLVVRHFGSAPA